ncbi:MAG: type II toxin-antitoxin system VapC family toxin [Acidobacteriota bacterium]
MRFVLDASVALAWCFEDEASAETEGVLEQLGASAAVVPSVWPLEVANALLVAERRKRVSRAKVAASLNVLRGLPISVDKETPARAFEGVLPLAREHGLSVYDAAYLELAIREGLPLATVDQGLKGAARRLGLELAGARR